MRSRMIAFCLAIIAVCQFPYLPQLSSSILVAVTLCGALLCLHSSFWVGLPAAVIVGLGWGVLDAKSRMDAVLPQVLEEYDFWVTGEVRGLPEVNGRAQQLTFWVHESCFEIMPSQCGFSSHIFSNRLILLNYYGDADIAPGQVWRWRVRLNQPHGFANPGGFDYEAWLLMRGFAAKGYVRATTLNHLLGSTPAWLDSMRYRLRERLTTATADLRNSGSLLALIMGERGQVSDQQWALFSATGTNHLIVISGLHVGFIALLCFFLGNGLARISPSLLRKVAAQRVGALCAIGGATVYSLLAGFSLPTQRAVIMLIVFMGARLLAREYPRSLSFWLAMSLVLVLNPMSPVGAGFWLSFCAVATLLFALGSSKTLEQVENSHNLPVLVRLRAWWRVWGAPQWAVFIGLSVPLLFWTQQLSLISPLANLFAIPLVSLLIVPIALLGACILIIAPSLAGWLLSVADALLTVLQAGLTLLASAGDGNGLWQGAFLGGWLSVGLSIAACVLMLLPRGWPGKSLAPLLLLPMLWPAQIPLPAGRVHLWVLDVGQGLAILVRSANHVVLFDTGPAFSASFDAGSGVILPFLRQLGIGHIDHLIVSHGDNDHQGGLRSVLQGISVGTVSVSAQPRGVAHVNFCQAGQTWEFDGVQFQFLMPQDVRPFEGNDGSCVLRIDTGGHSALLTGDIERPAEQALLAAQGKSLHSTVLIAPHHGSRTSSSPAFVAAVQPEVVVYSAGYRSQFGHPAPQVSALYASRGVCAWNTALSGALLFELDAVGGLTTPLKPTEYRLSHRRYWHLVQNAQSKRLHGLADDEC